MNRSRLLRTLLVLYALAVLVALVPLWLKIPWPGGFGRAGRRHGALAIVDIKGPIRTSLTPSAWGGPDAEDISRRLYRLSEVPRVKAILLRINSPGGTVGAVQEIHTEVLRCRARGKKVVASLSDVAASGGYYVASAADHIVADSGTITGSIGVIVQFGNLEGLFEKVGVRLETVKSGVHKDMGSPARSLTPEERRLLQGSIDDAYNQFIEAVAKGRGLPLEKVRGLATGRIFTGRQALAAGLVDELGNRRDAVQAAIELARLPKKPEILPDSSRSLGSLLGHFSSLLEDRGWKAAAEPLTGPVVEYRWR